MHMSGIQDLSKNYISGIETTCKYYFSTKSIRAIICATPPRRTIEKHRLHKGVLCKKCDYVNEMYYKQGYFICPVCLVKSKEALYETLLQYQILVSPRISNKEFRRFFNIHCVHIASKILAKAGLEKHGTNKGAYYIIPEKFE